MPDTRVGLLFLMNNKAFGTALLNLSRRLPLLREEGIGGACFL